jgi:hypothetical protein
MDRELPYDECMTQLKETQRRLAAEEAVDRERRAAAGPASAPTVKHVTDRAERVRLRLHWRSYAHTHA